MNEDKTIRGRVHITIDCENRPPIMTGVFGEFDRQLEFIVEGDGTAELDAVDVDGFWMPGSAGVKVDLADQFNDQNFPFARDITIAGGESATLMTFERNPFEIEREYRVRVTCADGNVYEADGEHSPPRMRVPRR